MKPETKKEETQLELAMDSVKTLSFFPRTEKLRVYYRDGSREEFKCSIDKAEELLRAFAAYTHGSNP